MTESTQPEVDEPTLLSSNLSLWFDTDQYNEFGPPTGGGGIWIRQMKLIDTITKFYRSCQLIQVQNQKSGTTRSERDKLILEASNNAANLRQIVSLLRQHAKRLESDIEHERGLIFHREVMTTGVFDNEKWNKEQFFLDKALMQFKTIMDVFIAGLESSSVLKGLEVATVLELAAGLTESRESLTMLCLALGNSANGTGPKYE